MRIASTVLGGITAAGIVGAMLARRRRHHADLTGMVALVTGGSRGLGLLIARELARRGCRLTITARNPAELAAAEQRLVALGAQVHAISCDLTDPPAIEELVAATIAHHHRLDIVVNNAGIIQVGPLTAMTEADFTDALDIMLLAPIRLTLAALPWLRVAPAGRIINITSIGGAVSVPHLLPYSVAKFGAVGFSRGLRAELAGEPVSVTTVLPGLMRTGSHLRAEFTGRAVQEYSWFSAAASAPLVAMNAERAARRIVQAALAGRAELTLTPLAVLGARFAGLAPATTGRLLALAGRLLPDAGAGAGVGVQTGHEVSTQAPSRVRSALTTLGRRAAQRHQPAVRGLR